MAVHFSIMRKGKTVELFPSLRGAKSWDGLRKGDILVREYGGWGCRGDMEMTYTGAGWRAYRDSDWYDPVVERIGVSQNDRKDRLKRKVVRAIDRYLREGNGKRKDRVVWLKRTVRALIAGDE